MQKNALVLAASLLVFDSLHNNANNAKDQLWLAPASIQSLVKQQDFKSNGHQINKIGAISSTD
jgi:hypothetical protein